MQIKYIFLIVVIVLGAFCIWNWVDRYDTIDPQIVSVVAERPFAFHNRNAGGTIWPEVLTPGQRKLGNGPVVRYDVPTSVQQAEFDIDVNMADRINQQIKITLNYNLLADGKAPIHLVLNALPLDDLIYNGSDDDDDEKSSKDIKYLSRMNSLKVVTFKPSSFFDKLLRTPIDMIIRDVTDSFTSTGLNEVELQVMLEKAIVATLKEIKIPYVTIDDQGNPYFCETCTMSPMDLVSINGVMVKDYQMPEELKPDIERAKQLEAKIQAAKNQELGLVTDRKIAKDRAIAASQINKQLKDLFNKNSKAAPYMKLNNFIEKIETGKLKNVKMFLVPEGSTTLIKDN